MLLLRIVNACIPWTHRSLVYFMLRTMRLSKGKSIPFVSTSLPFKGMLRSAQHDK